MNNAMEMTAPRPLKPSTKRGRVCSTTTKPRYRLLSGVSDTAFQQIYGAVKPSSTILMLHAHRVGLHLFQAWCGAGEGYQLTSSIACSNGSNNDYHSNSVMPRVLPIPVANPWTWMADNHGCRQRESTSTSERTVPLKRHETGSLEVWIWFIQSTKPASRRISSSVAQFFCFL